jgi:hypothetical protein
MAKFWALTFHSEGPPHDSGQNLIKEERKFRRLISPYFDHYVSYTPRSISPDGPAAVRSCADYSEWLANHPRRNELGRYCAGWAKLGFMGWKPYIIKKMLMRKDVRNGDIIFYHDVNISKYPVYRECMKEWPALSLRVLDELDCDVFVPAGDRLKAGAKTSLLRKYLGTAGKAADGPGLWGALIVIRKSPASIRFVNEWLKISSRLDDLSPLPNPRPHKQFYWHCPEQATLAVVVELWRRRGQLPQNWPKYYADGRRFCAEFLRVICDFPTFGNTVLGLRMRSRLSLSASARKIGISPEHLGDLEMNRKIAGPKEALSFAAAYGVAPRDLVQLALQDAVRDAGLDPKSFLSRRLGI